MSRITFTDAAGEEVEVEADLSGMVLTLANDASKAATTADIMAAHRHFHVGFDPASGPETSVIYVVDAGDVVHILPESEAREWEAGGHTIRELPPKKPGSFAPDHAYNLPKLTEQQLRAFGADSWDIAPPTWHVPDDGPNAGKQAPPPRREWWAEQCKGKGTPGNGDPWNDPYRGSRGVTAHPDKKRARKAQKLARKANRSK